MKRFLCVALLLALVVPVLLIPASAAEEYVFEWVNPEVMLLGDAFSFGSFGNMFLMFDGLLPEGTYRVDFYNDSAEFVYSCFLSEAVCLEYSDLDGQFGCLISCVISFQSDVDSFVFPLSMLVVVDEADNMTGVQFYNPETSEVVNLAAEFDYMVLTPVPPVPSLSDYVFSDSFDGVLNEIIALLPVVMVVLVGYIGIRKGIAWVFGLLHGA